MSRLLSEDDEPEKTTIKSDNLSRWISYARFQIPGTQTVIQIPWGFGLGGLAAIGAQLAALLQMGTGEKKVNSYADVVSNITRIANESFFPLPLSRIPPTESFLGSFFDTILPSPLKPLFQFITNKDGLGYRINTHNSSKYGAIFIDKDNIDNVFTKLSQNLSDIGLVVTPATLQFFGQSYFDGMTRLIVAGDNLALMARDDVETDIATPSGQRFVKKTFPLISSFVSNLTPPERKQFFKIEKKLRTLSNRIKSLEKSQDYERIIKLRDSDPIASALIDHFNSDVINGELKTLREQRNVYQRNSFLDPKQKAELLDHNRSMQDLIKRQWINFYANLGIKP
jgi:hypothetical protein